MQLGRVGPGRKAGHAVELAKQTAHELVGVVFRTEKFEMVQDPGDCGVGLRDRPLGVVLALLREALAVLEEFFPIEVSHWNRCVRDPRRAYYACHATPRQGHTRGR